MKYNTLISLLLLGSLLFVICGCQKDETANLNNTSSPDNIQPPIQGKSMLGVVLAANYSLKSSDSIQAVNIDIQQLSYHASGDSSMNAGWIELPTTPGIYNLMDYVAEDTLIAFDTLEAVQTISQIRILLGDSNTVMIDSVLYPLATPSAQQSGLKVQVHTQMVPDSSYVIMLDFDPEQSIKQTGNGKYILKPVIQTLINP
jgi:hypothetical protein